MENFKHLEIEMSVGNEILNANFSEEHFSISADKNKELEYEIKDELDEQLKKKYPSACPNFIQKVCKK